LGRGWSKEKRERGGRSGTKNLSPHNTDISSSPYIYGYTRRRRSGKEETSGRSGIPLKERQVDMVGFPTKRDLIWMRSNMYSIAHTAEHTEGFCFSLKRVPEHSKSLWAHNLLEIRTGEGRDNSSEYKNTLLTDTDCFWSVLIFTKMKGHSLEMLIP
jgi:hypothetical protein